MGQLIGSLSDEDSQVQIGKQNYWNSRYAEWKMDEAAKKWICWMTGSAEKMADRNLDEISGCVRSVRFTRMAQS